MEGLTVGRIVHYVLAQWDADAINRLRNDAENIGERIAAGTWPNGTQAHVGNVASPGQHCPAIVVRRNGNMPNCNLKVFLDGNGDYWATSRDYNEHAAPGTWHWIEKA
jgi:hypothetical protein